ncbi:MAG: hypothetical protein LC733_13280, partial [Actinobacteria bacterium]|nr:hypothetical protein [Actinomycetota bacterium]
GVHLGCYGWVEDLRPDDGAAAESLGYVHAPSLSHAVAAAVLRSGRQAHSESGAFDLDLSSARVREAVRLLEGVAAGQSIAALVGYRIERRLRDANLAQFIVPLRLQAPLQHRSAGRDQPVESMAARDVVDGVRLLTIRAGAQWPTVATAVGASAADRARIEAVLDEVAGQYDAVTDVLFAETIHQTAAGNLDRAGAAAQALDRQERPVEPDVIRTPRGGAVVTNRVVVVLRSPTRVPEWPARGVRGHIEPRLDRWLGTVLGPPSELSVGGRLVRTSGTTDLGTVSAVDVGLSPLAFVMAAQRPAADQPSELEARMARVFAERVVAPTAEDRIELTGATLLRTLTGWASRLASTPPLAVTDLTLAERERRPGEAPGTPRPPAGTVDLEDLRTRMNGAVTAVRTAAGAMASLPQTQAGLRRALLAVSDLLGVDALPVAPAGHPEVLTLLREQAERVSAQLASLVVRIDAALAEPEPAPSDARAQVERLVGIIKLALGSSQPVLPVITLAEPAELTASAADRAALLGGDGTAAVTWLHRAALVRPELDGLSGLLTHAEARGADVVGQVVVAQLPHRPGARWCELPFGPEGPPPAGTTGLVVVAPDGFGPSRPIAGLAVDAWAEVIPETEHTRAGCPPRARPRSVGPGHAARHRERDRGTGPPAHADGPGDRGLRRPPARPVPAVELHARRAVALVQGPDRPRPEPGTADERGRGRGHGESVMGRPFG